MIDFMKEKQNTENFLLIADTHDLLWRNDDFDFFIDKVGIPGASNQQYQHILLLGDISSEDIKHIVEKFPDLAECGEIYGICGNHDTHGVFNWFGVKDLHGKMEEIGGWKVAGFEGTAKYKDRKFPSMTQEESVRFARKLLANGMKPDILISHEKPKLFWLPPETEEAKQKEMLEHHGGLAGVGEMLCGAGVPLNLHGHHHQNYHKTLLNGTEEFCIFPFGGMRIWKDGSLYIYDMEGKRIL